LSKARIPLYILLATIAGVALAQESHNLKSVAAPSGSSTSAPAKKASHATERVILKVGDVQITQTEFESRIGDIEPQGDAEKEGDSDKDRRRLGDDYASVLMLSQQALANHLDSSLEVSRQLAVDRIQILSDAQFASLMRQATPTPDEIGQYYSAHRSAYDEVQIRRLFIWKRREGSKVGEGLSPQVARASADTILKASASRSNANKLAEGFKDSKDALLDAAPSTFPRGELPAQMEQVAFAMKEGEWAEVEDTPNRLVLIQLVKRRHQELDEVSSLIEQRLQGQKVQSALDAMKKNAGIWMDEQYFGTVVPAAQMHGTSPLPQLGQSENRKKEEKSDRYER
jgi:hypothetical protein